MKLRVRSQESKETLKMEVPDSCTLQQFKQNLSQQISSPSSSLSSIAVSLNGKDEFGGRPDDSLQTLGVTSGDLIFYSLNPNLSAPQTLVPDAPKWENLGNLAQSLNLALQRLQKSDAGMAEFGESGTLSSDENLIHDAAVRQLVSRSVQGGITLGKSETPASGKTVIQSGTVQQQEFSESDGSYSSESDMDEADIGQSETLDSNIQKEETMEGMDIDEGSGSAVVENRFSVPYFLRKVLRDELTDDGSDHRLSVIALHAVMLDSGLVPFDSMSNTMVDRFHLPDEWPSNSLTMSLWYTLPVLIDNESEIIETVVLKLSSLGQYIIVHGSLARNGSELHTVRLDEYRFASTIDLIWGSKRVSTYETSSNSYPENEVFEFWKIVKDGLALPLLIDLCDRAGLNLPPCLMRLPAELKVKILELIPGVDLAKVECVCSEFRYLSLSSNNDLWKQKVREEFGHVISIQPAIQWKAKFASWWESRKERKRLKTTVTAFPVRPYLSGRRNLEPFGILPIIGGEHDIWPVLGFPPANRIPITRSMPQHRARRTFSPNCNLGRFSP